MQSAADKFAEELKALGYTVERLADNRVAIAYTIQAGRFEGKKIKLGFEIPGDYELSAPTGPHVSPRLVPLNPGAPAHPERAHESPFGSEWQYFSRPYHQWAQKRTAKRYLEYVAHILNTL